MVINKLELINTACPDLPNQSSRRESSTESGKRRYSEPSQVVVVKKESMG